MTIISASYEHGATKLLLDESQLPPAFFDLRTGFAGEFVQKLVNYRILVAAVFRDAGRYSDRFQEFIGEARKGSHFRTFCDEAAALHWLDSQP